jgi:hypothetical protein
MRPSCSPGIFPVVAQFLLAGGDGFPHSDLWHGSAYHCGDLAYLEHQLVELIREQRLGTVGERLVGLVVHFHEQAISSDGYCCTRQRSDFVAFAGAVAGIDQDRQMAQALYRWHQTQIERVPRVIRKSPDTAFAESDVVVAFAQNVFRGHEKFF